mgnify:CR=1 FL=1
MGPLKFCLGPLSLSQGGPPPSFLEASVYHLLVNQDISLNSRESDTHFTDKDKLLLNRVLECEVFDSLTEVIVENGYTGKIDAFHREDIVETIKINIITKRLCYL